MPLKYSREFEARYLLIFLLIFLRIPGLLGQDRRTVTITERLGNSVTLHTGVNASFTATLIRASIVVWTFNTYTTIAKLVYGKIEPSTSERLQLDPQTGSLSITNISNSDSGIYQLQIINGQVQKREFDLNVYNPVKRPHITSLQASSPSSVRSSASGSCWVLCSVENGRDVTLSWYRGTETLNQTSSPDLSTSLSLPLEIEHRYTYYCEAKNPADTQHLPLDISEYCNETSGYSIPSPRSFLVPVSVGCSFVLIIIIIYLKKRKCDRQREDASASRRLHEYTDNTEYAEVIHSNQNHSQQQRISELGPGSAPIKLTTVYEELRPHL